MIVDSGVRFEYKGKKGIFNWVQISRNHDAAIDWCCDNFGEGSNTWFYNKNKFYFTNRDDVTLFLVRWA